MIYKDIVAVLIAILFSGAMACSSAEKKNISSVQSTVVSRSNISSADLEKKKKTSLLSPTDFVSAKPEIITLNNDELKVTLYARYFAQGNGVYAEIEKISGGSDPSDLILAYRNVEVPVTVTSWGFRGLWGIDPEQKPGNSEVVVRYRMNGVDKVLVNNIKIRDIEYPVSKSTLDVGKFSDKNYTSDPKFKELIAECTALRNKAFSSVTEDSIQSTLSHPRDMHKITGDYWRKRIYLVYEKKKKKRIVKEGKTRFHRGVDLKGAVGSPVFAMADGMVVLSHSMFYEGDMVIIDHGNQVFSYYQHLDSRKVNAGDRVKAGDIIGGVGATGMVTGPHLHAAFSIRGVHIDPLSILSLPVSR